jgi:hypothetical protein
VTTACPICQGPVPQPARGRPRAYCSRACQAKGYRARAAASAADSARVEMPGEPGTPLREYGEAVLAAAREMARVLDDGAEAPAAAARLAQVARDLAVWADTFAPVVVPARDGSREGRTEKRPARRTAKDSARDETLVPPAPAPAATPAPSEKPRPARRTAKDSARDETLVPQEVLVIEAKPQKMPRKRALAVAEAAKLERVGPRDANRWALRSGETVLGHVEPSYGGASRSGRNGWKLLLPGELVGRSLPTRNAAAGALAREWVQLVTSAPSRTTSA